MRIVHVIPYFSLRAGGPVVVVDRLCCVLARRRVESIVCTTDALADPRAPDGAAASREPWPPLANGEYELRISRSVVSRFAYSPTLATTLDDVVPTCDLVHVHTLWTHATAAAVRAARRHHVSYVVMPHGMLDPHSRARKPVRKWLCGHLFEYPRVRAAAGVVYTTVVEKDLAESSLRGLPVGYVVPLGADAPPQPRETLAARFRAAHPELADRRIVLFLGRVHAKKGLDLLVPAFARLLEDSPDAHLLIVGPDDAGYTNALQRQVRRLRIESHVTRIGLLVGDEKWAALAAADLFALPSYQENFAIAAAEALRSGTPVVLSDRVNIAPIVQAHGAGRVVPCRVEPLAAAMHDLLADADCWRKTSEAAVRLAQSEFTWERSADALLSAYRGVLRLSDAPAPRACPTLEAPA